MSHPERRVIAQCTVSIDGYSSGPEGPRHDTWLWEQAGDPLLAADHEGLWRGCSSAIVGRGNYEGFHAVWPGIVDDPATDPRTRELGRWLATVEKAVVSTTLTEATWGPSEVFADPRSAVDALRGRPGRDILVLNSASVIGALLRDDLVDELHLGIAPVLLGGGLRLLPDGVASSWRLAASTTSGAGGLVLRYHRDR